VKGVIFTELVTLLNVKAKVYLRAFGFSLSVNCYCYVMAVAFSSVSLLSDIHPILFEPCAI
jgi:hypothetical protein